MRILFLSRWFPYPPVNGSKIRVHNILRQLGPRHEVGLLSFLDQPGIDPDPIELRRLCRAIGVVPWRGYRPEAWRSRTALLSPTPRSIVDTFSAEMADRIRKGITAGGYDIVIASELTCASYASWFGGVPALFEDVEVGLFADRLRAAAPPLRRARAWLTWVKLRAYLSGLSKHFRGCTVVSERERRIVRHAMPALERIEIVPNGLDLAAYAGVSATPRAGQIVFTGSFRFAANYDAMKWFVGRVHPRILERIPEAQLTITGEHDGLPLPPSRNVVRAGFVDDVRPVIASAAVSVVPIREGGGTRLKILEAMALGVPVVSTRKGAEGLDVEDGVHLLLADDADEFAGHVIRLLQRPDLRRRIAAAAKERVARCYDWRSIGPGFERFVESLVST